MRQLNTSTLCSVTGGDLTFAQIGYTATRGAVLSTGLLFLAHQGPTGVILSEMVGLYLTIPGAIAGIYDASSTVYASHTKK